MNLSRLLLLANVILTAQLTSYLLGDTCVLHGIVDPWAAIENERGTILQTVKVFSAASRVLKRLTSVFTLGRRRCRRSSSCSSSCCCSGGSGCSSSGGSCSRGGGGGGSSGSRGGCSGGCGGGCGSRG